MAAFPRTQELRDEDCTTRISIIVPAFNGARFLEQTIESVLAQTLAAWELVIVDDGSADDTAALAERYARQDARVRLVRQSNAGVGAARNRGLAEADTASEYVIFLDHDDVWENDALERLSLALQDDPGAVVATGLSRVIDALGEPRDPGELEIWGRHRQGIAGHRLVAWPASAPTTLAVLAYGNCIYSPGQALIRRSALAAVGPFDASLSPADDWDMWLRLSVQSHIAFVDRVVLNWRAHGGNGSRQKERIFHLHGQARRKLVASPALSQHQRIVVLLANWHWGRRVRGLRLQRAKELAARGEVVPAIRQLGAALGNYWSCLRGVPVTAPVLRPTLKELYRSARATPGDINEHLDTLRRLARHCGHVTEFGTRGGISTTALLAGRPRALVTYDRQRYPGVDLLEGVAREGRRTRFVFRQADVLQIEIEETDLLFIDTWHVCEQLRHELALHAGKVRSYLVFHDTETFGRSGEAPGSRGLWPAIEEFLREHPHWSLSARLENNNGLTILTRQGAPVPAFIASKAVAAGHAVATPAQRRRRQQWPPG